MKFYAGVKFLLSGFFKIIYNLNIHNADRVPDTGRYVVVSNHISLGDVIILGISCERQIHFMAKQELFKVPALAQLIRLLGAFPVDRKGSASSALKTAIKVLKDDNIVGLFPQGTRCRNISVEDTVFKNGAAFCITKSSSGFIPVFIKTKGQKFGLFKRCDIYYGQPVEFSALIDESNENIDYDKITQQIKNAVFELEKHAYGGKYNG